MGALRELATFKEFRLPAVPAGVKLRLADLSEPAVAPGGAVAGGADVAQVESGELFSDEALASLCIGVWRVRRRMIDPTMGTARDEMRAPYRHLEAVWDTLAQSGVDIRDHTGELVPEYGSFALDVLAYQPTPGIVRDRVVDTIKPSVYVRGRLVQMGQVIVGTPEGASEGSEGGRTP